MDEDLRVLARRYASMVISHPVARMGTADAERGLVELVLLSVRGDVCSVVHLVSESETD